MASNFTLSKTKTGTKEDPDFIWMIWTLATGTQTRAKGTGNSTDDVNTIGGITIN